MNDLIGPFSLPRVLVLGSNRCDESSKDVMIHQTDFYQTPFFLDWRATLLCFLFSQCNRLSSPDLCTVTAAHTLMCFFSRNTKLVGSYDRESKFLSYSGKQHVSKNETSSTAIYMCIDRAWLLLLVLLLLLLLLPWYICLYSFFLIFFRSFPDTLPLFSV